MEKHGAHPRPKKSARPTDAYINPDSVHYAEMHTTALQGRSSEEAPTSNPGPLITIYMVLLKHSAAYVTSWQASVHVGKSFRPTVKQLGIRGNHEKTAGAQPLPPYIVLEHTGSKLSFEARPLHAAGVLDEHLKGRPRREEPAGPSPGAAFERLFTPPHELGRRQRSSAGQPMSLHHPQLGREPSLKPGSRPASTSYRGSGRPSSAYSVTGGTGFGPAPSARNGVRVAPPIVPEQESALLSRRELGFPLEVASRDDKGEREVESEGPDSEAHE